MPMAPPSFDAGLICGLGSGLMCEFLFSNFGQSTCMAIIAFSPDGGCCLGGVHGTRSP
jgi:hypothetical protein